MSYKCTRSNHNGYRVKTKQIRRMEWVIRIELVFFGVTGVLSVTNRLLNKNEKQVHINYEKELSCEEEFELEKIIDTTLNNYDSLTTIKEIFIKYCHVYNLDYSIIYNKAYEITDGFKSEYFINNNCILGTKVCGKERSFNDFDMGILCFVRHCKQIPQDFGFIKEQIIVSDVSEETSIDCEILVSEYCKNTTYTNKELVMAIIYSENGRDLTGKQLIENNNPGCLRTSDGKMNKFENLEQGIIEQILNLEYKFIDDRQLYYYDLNEMIEELQKVYAPIEDPENKKLCINENWSKNVKDIYIELYDDYYSIFNERKRLNSGL